MDWEAFRDGRRFGRVAGGSRRCSSGEGPSTTWKWRWGAGLLPVLPTLPGTSPRLTRAPGVATASRVDRTRPVQADDNDKSDRQTTANGLVSFFDQSAQLWGAWIEGCLTR